MKIYLLDDILGKGHNAAYKAKNDVNRVFLSDIEGSTSVFSFYKYIPPNFGMSNKLKRFVYRTLLFRLNQINFFKFLRMLNTGDIVIMPFPFEFQWFIQLTSYVYRKIGELKRNKNVKVIFVIHDLNCLRFPDLYNEDAEIPILKLADVIIAHNQVMIEWLVSRGISADKLINLQLFDYLSSSSNLKNNLDIDSDHCPRKVIYAGNLSPWKSEFIYRWSPGYNVELYGIGLELEKVNKNVAYKGFFESDQPTFDVSGICFGLVWDGSSVEGLLGSGEYLKYNNPHKISLYLSQGLPVIVSAESALASFVVDNNLGFAVHNLNDIDNILREMKLIEYQVLKSSVCDFGTRLCSGGYMKEALRSAVRRVSSINNIV